jgi:hypothetical protein
MNFEEGKYYKTRDGHKARVLCTDYPTNDYVVYGYVYLDTGIKHFHWQKNGRCYLTCEHEADLVAEWTEPKPPKLLAPAIIKVCGSVGLSSTLYSSEEEAREELHGMVVSWPAIPNKDGYYSVGGKL